MKPAEIVEYHPKYNPQVKKVVFSVLKSLGFLPSQGSSSRDADLDKIRQVYSGRGRFWVALKNDKVVGTVAIEKIDEKTAKLKRMFVLTRYHGTGIGQMLLNRALRFAREKSYKQITLNTSLVMKRAQRFYEKNGFKKLGEDEEKCYYAKDL